MKKLIILFFFLFYALPVFAIDPQPIQIEPLSGVITFSTVTLDGTNWTTAPTVELRGRKEINILNTSSTENIFLYGANITSNSVMIDPTEKTIISRRLFPQDNVTFKVSSSLHIYISSNTSEIVVEITEIK